MELRCPKCRLINPPDTERCDCGWEFATNRLSDEAFLVQKTKAAKRARASWIYPLAAWAPSMIAALVMLALPDGSHNPALGFLFTLLAIVQGGLIIVGLYLGLKVLTLGRSSLPPGTWCAALIGVILSGGTILLVVGMAIVKG